MNIQWSRLTLAVMGMSLSQALWAQTPKIGFVSIDRIMLESKSAKSAREDIQRQFKPLENQLSTKASDIRKLQAALTQSQTQKAGTETDELRTKQEAELNELLADFEKQRQEYEGKLLEAQNSRLKELLKRTENVIKQEAKARDLDLVVQDALYVKPELDLTLTVIGILDN